MSDFQHKYGPWAIVAGASEGLGAAFATALAMRGLNLLLIARRAEKLEALASELRKNYSVEVQWTSLDLSDTDNCLKYLESLDLDIGLLIYNAAYAPIGYFEDVSLEQLDKIVQVNIRTPLLCTKTLSNRFIERKKGGIVLMSSLAGTQGSPKISTYAASKAFNTILAEGLWAELKTHNIDVLASCAGAIRTPGYQQAQQQKEAPGTMDALEVAEQTLDSLDKGPTTVPGSMNRFAQFLMGRLLPRKTAISIMDSNTKDLN